MLKQFLEGDLNMKAYRIHCNTYVSVKLTGILLGLMEVQRWHTWGLHKRETSPSENHLDATVTIDCSVLGVKWLKSGILRSWPLEQEL